MNYDLLNRFYFFFEIIQIVNAMDLFTINLQMERKKQINK